MFTADHIQTLRRVFNNYARVKADRYRGTDFDIDHLETVDELAAAFAVLEQLEMTFGDLKGFTPSGGGCRAFYTPREWAEREELYCRSANLIVVYDGGDLAPFFNFDYGSMAAEDMTQHLRRWGLWSEAGTCWYSGIYKLEDA